MSEWTSIAQPMHYIVELDAPLTVRRERGVLVQGDENANAFVLAIYQQKGVPADLTGCTVTMTFLRPDNLVVPPITATIDGNVATATLTAACYRVSGMYGVLVTLAKDGAERTILKTIGDMISTENSGMVDEEGVFPTPEELLAALEQVETARQNAITAAENANANAAAANAAAGSANSAAAAATDAATAANTATSNANAAADRANQAAAEVEGGTAPDSNKLGGKAPEYYLSPRNLLDNSDFTNPVNQRGATSYNSSGYTIDRWRIWDNSNLTKNDGYISISGSLFQCFEKGTLKNVNHTLAACKTDGTISIVVNNPYADYYWNNQLGLGADDSGVIIVSIDDNDYVWAALYEGSYTAETLPPYVPKGYAVELAECRRYYQADIVCDIFAQNATYGQVSLNFLPPLIASPSVVTLKSFTHNGYGEELGATKLNLNPRPNAIYKNQCTVEGVEMTPGQRYQARFDVSADL